ncbi:MAG: serine/threonine-protein kinase [Bryobacteraceae bacterium]|nr:serine/threonine-protein kinase [Bryobacteraceae bacterium]
MIKLQPGGCVGPYEIVALLGTGGMGRVYRARDTRLGREVALKVLPPELATDPDRKERFEHEARTAGALKHPNIVAVFDVGNVDGVSYIVSEIVEGETLRARMERGAMGRREAIDIASQVADALAAAHAASIVHRDLKPENVMITRSGLVKLLDFGLARHLELPRAVSSTITAIATRPGMIVGTVAYMSPEQVRGVPADPRSDIFSFGSILYEMLSGTRPFRADTPVETLSAILRQEPPRLPEAVSANMARIVARCIEKNPEQRFQSAGDLSFALRALTSTASGVAAVSAPPSEGERRPPRWRAILPWAIAALFAIAFVLAAIAPRGPDISAFTFRPIASGDEPEMQGAWSPDGRSVAYVALVGLTGQVFVKSLGAPAPVQLTALGPGPGANLPFWSPDGNRIYFLWRRRLWTVARAGGDPEPVFTGPGESLSISAASLSPDGKTLAIWRSTRGEGDTISSVWLSSPPGAAPQKYEPSPFEVTGTFGVAYLGWAPDGSKLMASFYRTEGPEAWILPFPGGDEEPRRVFEPLLRDAAPSFSWFPDSRHVALALVDAVNTRGRLWVADSESDRAYPVTAGDGRQYYPSVSADGRSILYTSGALNYDVIDVPIDGSPPRPLRASRRFEAWLTWSPVAPEFAYATDIGGEQEIRVQNRDTRREHVAVSPRAFPGLKVTGFQSPVFSPDGARLAFSVRSETQLSSVWIAPVVGGVPVRLTAEGVYARSPSWSPDGRWIAHQELRDGRVSLVKTRVGANLPGQVILQRGCAETPSWSPAGGWIVCGSPDGLAIVSEDGMQERNLGRQYLPIGLWSKDGSHLYVGLLQPPGATLGMLDWRTGEFRKIVEWPPAQVVAAPIEGTMSVSMAPDGLSFATTVIRMDTDLWLLEGLDLRSSLLDWLLPWRRGSGRSE